MVEIAAVVVIPVVKCVTVYWSNLVMHDLSRPIACEIWTVLTCTDFEIQQYENEINKELQASAGE